MAKTNKIFEAVKKIPAVAAKEKWVITLDKNEGALFYSPRIIPDKTELYQVSDEYALYLDKKFNPRGVMVEYFSYNFVKHHPEISKLSKRVFKKAGKEQNEEIVVDPNKSKKDDDVAILKSLLETTLIAESLASPKHN